MNEKEIINKKGVRGISALIVVVIIVIAVVVVGVGIYAATRGGKTSPSASPTPTPSSSASATTTPTSIATASPTPTSTSTSGIATASSYEFNLTGTASNGTVLDTAYYATKNLGTSSVELHWEVTTPSAGTIEYIINGALQKAWLYQGGQWTDISVAFTSDLSTVESAAGLYVNMLTYYGGSGSFTYTVPAGQPNAGFTDTFTNVHINPSLPDSLFQGPS
jgi:hypothetical protein